MSRGGRGIRGKVTGVLAHLAILVVLDAEIVDVDYRVRQDLGCQRAWG